MKKRVLLFTVIAFAIFCIPLSVSATDDYDYDDYGCYHSYEFYNIQSINSLEHGYYDRCYYCGEIKLTSTGPHEYMDSECVRLATLKGKGIERNYCVCGYAWDEYFPWQYDGYGCASYDIVGISPVYKKSKSVTIRLKNSIKGSVLKVKIGKKTYKANTKGKKTIKLKIKKTAYGSIITPRLYYKGRLIGKDVSDDWDCVLYAKDIKKGMKKKQVKYTYYWGSPDDTASASGGWSYWYYDDGSYIAFKKGKVKHWYNAAN